jgi:predicted DNA-binding protein (MmcQ/YjbR family)
MLSQQVNRFLVCSAIDEIVFAYEQHVMKSFPHWLSLCLDVHVKAAKIRTLVEHTRKFVRRRLNVR